MFDIGFAELLIIGVVALLVIGPERLPETVRTASLWLNRIRRGFNEIKQEVQQELHNDSVMQELRKTGQQLQEDTKSIGHELKDVSGSLASPTPNGTSPGEQQESSTKKQSE
jgi:sec-independent protein translocase protein TatB